MAVGGWLASSLGKPIADAQGPWYWLSGPLGEAGTGRGTGRSREPLTPPPGPELAEDEEPRKWAEAGAITAASGETKGCDLEARH